MTYTCLWLVRVMDRCDNCQKMVQISQLMCLYVTALSTSPIDTTLSVVLIYTLDERVILAFIDWTETRAMYVCYSTWYRSFSTSQTLE